MADKIQDAYASSRTIYDTVLTQRHFFSRWYIKLFWSGTDDKEIAQNVLSAIPDDFSGTLLDVPVGTAVFTAKKWISLKNAHFTCLDCRTDKLAQARKRLDGQPHITCLQGVVGNNDESFNIMLSMNGFHAFPDKGKAFQETWRVLKPGCLFLYPRKIQKNRLAWKPHPCQKRLVSSAVPERGRTERLFAETVYAHRLPHRWIHELFPLREVNRCRGARLIPTK